MESVTPSELKDEVKVLELAVRCITSALDALLQECTDDDGKVKAPSKQAYMRARSALPDGYQMTLVRRSASKRKDAAS